MNTSFLASVAEFCHLTSVTAITVCCLLMFAFILKFFLRDIFYEGRDSNSADRILNQVPQVSMARVQLPVHFVDVSSKPGGADVNLRLRLADGPILVRAYWGVSVSAFHHVLKGSWHWFQDAFLHGNLFGESGCLGLGDLKTISAQPEDADRLLDLTEIKPERTVLELGPAPRQTYPLVICCLMENSREDDSFGAFLSVIHIKDEVCSIGTHVLASYVKSRSENSVATHLVPMFTTEEAESGDTVCAVCQEKPVTRVMLPCKHACTCKRCFEKLNSRWCPMCRAFIQSFFIIGREDDADVDADADGGSAVAGGQQTSWRQRLDNLNHRFAMAMGLQEN